MIPKDDVIRAFNAILNNQIRQIIENDFEGWNGTIRVDDYELDVDLTLRKTP